MFYSFIYLRLHIFDNKTMVGDIIVALSEQEVLTNLLDIQKNFINTFFFNGTDHYSWKAWILSDLGIKCSVTVPDFHLCL
jgi:hypothetical protein